MQISELRKIIDQFKNKRVLVIGDLMIDHYIWGKVDRISPEAPVPVVEVRKEDFRLGGAANVVNNIHALGAVPYVLGLIGNDQNAERMRDIFIANGISNLELIADESRNTTIKTRVIAHNQQVVRIDRENDDDVARDVEDRIIERFEALIPQVDAVLIEDYNKGLLTERVINTVIDTCNKLDKIVTVDPKFRNFFAYKNCTVFKPNLKETEKNLGIEIKSEDDFLAAAHKLLDRLEPEYVVVTRSEKGLSVFSRTADPISIPTFAMEVYDVSGAGDTVISTLTLCLAAGCDMRTSALIANHAAGKVCGKMGIHPILPDEIIDSFKNHLKA